MNITLSTVCALIIIFAITMYVLLDGFDLGVGILLLTEHRSQERNEMIETIAPIWDGNETWLILAAIVLFGAFPQAYAILLPAFYLPFMLMLISMGFRGVSIEFRAHTPFPRFWDAAFSLGSAVAAFCQGLVAGALLSGNVSVSDGQFTGQTLDVFNRFDCMMGAAAVAAYAMLGAAWIRWKSAGRLQHHQAFMLRIAQIAYLLLATLACTLAATTPGVESLWRMHPLMLILAGTTAFGFWLAAFRSMYNRSDALPLIFGLASVGTLLLGFVIALWPYLVPFSVSFDSVAASHGSQLIIAVGASVMLPVVLAYNAFAYWVFRGKVNTSRTLVRQ
ncbi:cytochrome d ubiquinol oxidase subunit II [Cupriavidus necator]|uniref:Cytochrome d ubiquinol oxidase subunit II n=1 Tax=Cupriavidus necator TaxID=106590 RepID=A0A1U9V1A8_CUPNE|nr:cytochrome d ubiquinol oxidase subunit II [Cupriavidus necator]AQV98155.1 cytochrome d ubiquinol oxidase subunit II [Cupriavidus necator]